MQREPNEIINLNLNSTWRKPPTRPTAPEIKPESPPFLNILLFCIAVIAILKRPGDRKISTTHVIQHIIQLSESVYETRLWSNLVTSPSSFNSLIIRLTLRSLISNFCAICDGVPVDFSFTSLIILSLIQAFSNLFIGSVFSNCIARQIKLRKRIETEHIIKQKFNYSTIYWGKCVLSLLNLFATKAQRHQGSPGYCNIINRKFRLIQTPSLR